MWQRQRQRECERQQGSGCIAGTQNMASCKEYLSCDVAANIKEKHVKIRMRSERYDRGCGRGRHEVKLFWMLAEGFTAYFMFTTNQFYALQILLVNGPLGMQRLR